MYSYRMYMMMYRTDEAEQSLTLECRARQTDLGVCEVAQNQAGFGWYRDSKFGAMMPFWRCCSVLLSKKRNDEPNRKQEQESGNRNHEGEKKARQPR